MRLRPLHKTRAAGGIGWLAALAVIAATIVVTAIAAAQAGDAAPGGKASPSAAATHWAFMPVTRPSPPAVKQADWLRNEVDRFVLAQLEAHHMAPSAIADKRTLVRRAYLDLHGVPPTPAQVAAFLADDSPDAWPRLIDQLLASPRYGERWGRYWLDLARYSDTKGYVYSDREERFFVHAHAYRDWVIAAFNNEMPYDRFLLLQIAADQLRQPAAAPAAVPAAATGDAKGSATGGTNMAPATQADMAAMGLLTLGRRFLGVIHDIVDDRIDVVMRSTQALTVGCARCHDHKYDPIPTEDYYSLYGVFANATEREVPINLNPPQTDAYAAFAKGLHERQQKLHDTFNAKRNDWAQRVRAQTGDYLAAVLDADKLWTEESYTFIRVGDLNPPFVRQWQSYLFRRAAAYATAGGEGNSGGAGGVDPIFGIWHAVAKLPADDFAPRAKAIIDGLVADHTHALNARVAQAFTASSPASMKDVAKRYAALLTDADHQWRDLVKQNPGADVLPDADAEALRQVLYASDSPVWIPDRSIYEAEFFFDEGTRVQLAKLQREIDSWLIKSPGAPPYAVILEDVSPELRKTARVFQRGNPARPGQEVPRRFLKLLAGPNRKPFAHGAGRLDLANAIIDKSNPLTARVMVNRIWQHHFGAGLVTTPSDFGMRAAPPSHRQLLDWLATRFMDEGWSIKAMHRVIMTSATYMQSGQRGSPASAAPATSAATASVDPVNRLLRFFPRRRLDFEAMRDAMLAVTGELDLTMGGRPVDLYNGQSPRRTVYGLVDRQYLPGVLRVFDFANPDLHVPARPATTSPQQALFFMNSPFAQRRAHALVQRIDREGRTDARGRIERLYQLLYQREPTTAQLDAGLQFIAALTDESAAPPPKVQPSAWSYGYGHMDESAGRTAAFTPLPHFTGSSYQGGPNWPDPALGWVRITAEGGHAGNDLDHAAIRRWTAPRDMTVAITSRIEHKHPEGDGIRAFMVSSRMRQAASGGGRTGVLGSWKLHNSSADANVASLDVKAGDTIDFIVDIGGGLNWDEFFWQPVIRELAPAPAPGAANSVKASWSSRAEFRGVVTAPQALPPWEMYAQVLLLANEFMFVD